MNNTQLPKTILIAVIGVAMLSVGLAGLSSYPTIFNSAIPNTTSFMATTQFQNPNQPIIGFDNQMNLITNQPMMRMMGPRMMMGGMNQGMMGGSIIGSMSSFNNQMMPMFSNFGSVPMQQVPVTNVAPISSINSSGMIPGTDIPLYPILLVGIYGGLVAAGASIIFRTVSSVRKTDNMVLNSD